MAEAPHILSSRQYDENNLGDIFERAAFFKRQISPERRRLMAERHIGYQLVTLFYEPSTRTRLSFESAAAKLGMGIVSTENAGEFSSAVKGETIEDTAMVVSGYGDIIIMRHPEPDSVARAAAVSGKPIINAGDGGNQHPTQAVLDAFTIFERYGRLDGLQIAFGGDLLYGRTVRSLVEILSRAYRDNSFTFIAPEELQLSDDIRQMLDERGAEYYLTTSRDEGIRNADGIYWTRLQKERLKGLRNWNKRRAIDRAITNGGYILNSSSVEIMKPDASILHPLPRVNEIDRAIDKDPRALYILQAHNAVPVRVTLLDEILRDAKAT